LTLTLGFGYTVGPCGFALTWLNVEDNKRVLFEVEQAQSLPFQQSVSEALRRLQPPSATAAKLEDVCQYEHPLAMISIRC